MAVNEGKKQHIKTLPVSKVDHWVGNTGPLCVNKSHSYCLCITCCALFDGNSMSSWGLEMERVMDLDTIRTCVCSLIQNQSTVVCGIICTKDAEYITGWRDWLPEEEVSCRAG